MRDRIGRTPAGSRNNLFDAPRRTIPRGLALYVDGIWPAFPSRLAARDCRLALKALGLRVCKPRARADGRRGARIGFSLATLGPERIAAVVAILERHRCDRLLRVELAIDWTDAGDADAALARILARLRLRGFKERPYRPRGCRTWYWDRDGAPLNLAAYSDGTSKLDLDPDGPPVPHVELRFGWEVLRDMGFDMPASLLRWTVPRIAATLAHFTEWVSGSAHSSMNADSRRAACRRGGLLGGRQRAAILSAERRRAIASRAARKRWGYVDAE